MVPICLNFRNFNSKGLISFYNLCKKGSVEEKLVTCMVPIGRPAQRRAILGNLQEYVEGMAESLPSRMLGKPFFFVIIIGTSKESLN